MFDSIRETIDYAVENNMSFADIMVKEEMELSGKSRDEVRAQMKQNLDVMRDAVIKGTTGDGVESVTGYTGHDAAKLRDYNETHHALSGYEMIDAVKVPLQQMKSMLRWVLFVQRQQLVPRVPFPVHFLN